MQFKIENIYNPSSTKPYLISASIQYANNTIKNLSANLTKINVTSDNFALNLYNYNVGASNLRTQFYLVFDNYLDANTILNITYDSMLVVISASANTSDYKVLTD